MGARILAGTMLAAFGVVSYNEYKGKEWPPRPFRYWGVVVVWSMLAILALVTPELAAAFSVGAVLGVYFGVLPGGIGPTSSEAAQQPQQPVSAAQQQAAVGGA